MKKKLTLEVEVLGIDVEDGYYGFKYIYSINGGKPKTGEYDSDFENGMTDKQWKKSLENGGALQTALQQIAEEY